MVFKAKIKGAKLKPDCKDFKPYFLDKGHCKLTGKCANAGEEYEMDCYLKYPDLCTGISFDRDNPPQGRSGIPICKTMEEVYGRLKSPSDIDRVFIQSGEKSKILVVKG